MERFPVLEHLYQNYMMDSLRWNFFSPRPDDIVVICLSGRGDKDVYEVARLRGETI